MAEAGASICLVQREPTNGARPNLATLNTIQPLGVKVEVVYCDLADLEAVKGVFQKALDIMGGQINILVNCAGIQRRSPSVDFTETDWDDVSSVRWNVIIIRQPTHNLLFPVRFRSLTSTLNQFGCCRKRLVVIWCHFGAARSSISALS